MTMYISPELFDAELIRAKERCETDYLAEIYVRGYIEARYEAAYARIADRTLTVEEAVACGIIPAEAFDILHEQMIALVNDLETKVKQKSANYDNMSLLAAAYTVQAIAAPYCTPDTVDPAIPAPEDPERLCVAVLSRLLIDHEDALVSPDDIVDYKMVQEAWALETLLMHYQQDK